MARILDAANADFTIEFKKSEAQRYQRNPAIQVEVAAIIEEVRLRGDEAVLGYGRLFGDHSDDHSSLSLRVSEDEWDEAVRRCDRQSLEALNLAAERIENFHRRQLPQALDYHDAQGLRLGLRWTPVDSAGLYTPGGKASYPSSVLMNAIPAKVAGVRRLVMAAPAPKGTLAPLVLAAARRAEVDEVYRVGGAQAIAALAYGTATIRAVDKITGPGNFYVTEAKRQLFGVVGIDMLAGPSEVVIVASRDNRPEWIAADLLAQAEHDSAAQAILMTDDHLFAKQVMKEVEWQLADLPRREIAAQSWHDHGVVIVLTTLEQAPALINRLAPEHLQLVGAEAEAMLDQVRHAGAVFIGPFAPEALGDYVAGPNHILPTGGGARYASGLGVWDFMKRTTVVGCDAKALTQVGDRAVTLAQIEGLQAHARSLELRLGHSDE